MQIKILGEHLSVTEAIKQYIHDKVSHLSIPEKISSIEFRIGKQKDEQYVKFHAMHPSHEPIILNSSDINLYSAIDKLMDKVHRNFVKSKECHHTHLHKAI